MARHLDLPSHIPIRAPFHGKSFSDRDTTRTLSPKLWPLSRLGGMLCAKGGKDGDYRKTNTRTRLENYHALL
jgi:hypothetical protein